MGKTLVKKENRLFKPLTPRVCAHGHLLVRLGPAVMVWLAQNFKNFGHECRGPYHPLTLSQCHTLVS